MKATIINRDGSSRPIFGEDDITRKIIRRNNNYSEAYGEMMDNGIEDFEADTAWNKYIDECGEDC